MKYLLIALLLCCMWVSVGLAVDKKDGEDYFFDYAQPRCQRVTFNSQDGRYATIDFSGKEIVYYSNMPVSESAKMFFEEIMGYKKSYK